MQRKIVGAEFFRGREGPAPRGALVLDLAFARGRHHLPVGRGADGERERGLQVGLVEQGEHLVGRGGFEMRIGVDLAIGRVAHPVQALAIGAVGPRIADRDGVAAGGQVGGGQRDEPVVVVRRDGLAVDRQGSDGGLVQVDRQRRGVVGQVEADGAHPAEVLLAGQFEGEHIVDLRYAGRARLGFGVGQECVRRARAGGLRGGCKEQGADGAR